MADQPTPRPRLDGGESGLQKRLADFRSSVTAEFNRRLLPTLRTWWNNPLLRHARRARPFPVKVVAVVLPVLCGVFTLLALLAWVVHVRVVGAALAALSGAAVLVPVFFAPVNSADRITRQMRFTKQDPRRLTDLPPEEVTWGLALVTLWKLRWPLMVALALTPALVISVFRLDIGDYTVWRSSVEALGAAASGSEVLLQGGRIPTARLLIRAVSAGLLPWVLLPAFAVAGVTSALTLRDASLSPLVALLGTVVVGAVLAGVWHMLTRTTFFVGSFEVMRLLVLAAMGVGVGVVARTLNDFNAGRLAALAEEAQQAAEAANTAQPTPAGTSEAAGPSKK